LTLNSQTACSGCRKEAPKQADHGYRDPDDGGNLIYLERMDETQIGSISGAAEGAQRSFRGRPTKVFEDAWLEGPHPEAAWSDASGRRPPLTLMERLSGRSAAAAALQQDGAVATGGRVMKIATR
jgi:uncharacterized protein GlcG (DUF336 family)